MTCGRTSHPYPLIHVFEEEAAMGATTPALDAAAALAAIAARGCESFTTGHGSCFRNGRSPLARFGAELACAGCIAWAALLPAEGAR